MGRILAIDYGKKRLGIAVSDESKTIAIPKSFFETKDFNGLLDFVRENNVEEIIIGYPLALSGRETESTKEAKEFANRIKDRLEIPVWLIDERLTTKEVLRELREMGQKLEKSKDMIDSFVAQKMLERYLEKLKR